ncbi:MAG: arginase family protein [Candidatus Pacearchaeota archaeon]|nr:arginase family protein [Candidatus Pacearchaeota archaeon]
MIIVEVPMINGLGKTKGCEDAPCMITTSLSKNRKNFQIVELNLSKKNLEESQRIIFKEAMDIIKKNKDNNEKILFLGGDHSISYPLVNAFNQVHPLPFLIVFDAHVDLMEPMKEPTHEEWLRAIIEKGFDSKNILLIGGQKIYDEEKDFLKKSKIRLVNKKEVDEMISNPQKLNFLNEYGAIYLSIDIDVLDSSFFSATGYPEKGGLSKEQFEKLLRAIFLFKNVKALDLVEINPDKDLNNKNVKLISEVLSNIFQDY